ncbi:unnamed protein product, partial [Didymodactylos carnosus]
MEYHEYKVDFEQSNMTQFYTKYKIIKYTLIFSEYVYFPLHGYILHLRSMLSPWWKKERYHLRERTLFIFCLRSAYFFGLYLFSNMLCLYCYLISYSVMVQVLRFTDCFTHDYDTVPLDSLQPRRCKVYDMKRTFSISFRSMNPNIISIPKSI